MTTRRAHLEATRLEEMQRARELDPEQLLERELEAAYAAANHTDVIETNVAADNILGGKVEGLDAIRRQTAANAAWQAEQINDLRRTAELTVEVTTSHGMRPWSQAATARRVTVTEVAAVLRIPDRTAERLIEESRMLVDELPATLAGLRNGDFSYRHAKSVIEHASSLGEELRAEFEQRIVPFASKLTPSKFDEKARTLRERMDSKTIKERHQRAVADRTMSWEPARDGMGWVHIYDTALNTRAIFERSTDLAITLRDPETRDPDDQRTLAQRRVDVAVDLLLNGDVPGRGFHGIRPSVVLTVPALSLLDHPSASGEIEPAILDGYGPIDLETAKRLVGNAKSWLRVLTHPITGVVLQVDSRKRKIPAGLRALLRVRDGTCRMVGCNTAAAHSELDHNVEYQNGGKHEPGNLEHLCEKHHAGKHHTPISLRHLPNGDIEWTLPSGATYISEPAMRMDGHEAA